MNEFFYSCMTSSIVSTAPFASSMRRGWNHPSSATNLAGLPKDYRHHCKVVLLEHVAILIQFFVVLYLA